MANITPIDKSVLFEIAEEIRLCIENYTYGISMDMIIELSNKIQDSNLQESILDICIQDSEAYTDQQCIEQLEIFISTL